jgi:O-antigen/teichoic acid export membrane protein
VVHLLQRLSRFLDRSDGSLQHKAVRSGVWVTLSSVLGAAFSFFRSIVLARLLTPEIFGLMAICSMVIRGIEIFTETGFGAALIHRQQRFEDARDTAFTLWVLRGIGLAAISFLLAPWVAAFYHEDVLKSIVAVIGVSFILTGFNNINTIALQKELDFKRLTYLEQIGGVLSTVISLGLAYWLRDVWALVYAQLASSVISVVLSYVMVPGRPRFRFDRDIARELFSYGKFMTGLAVVVFLTNQLDSALIGKLLGMEALGFYTVAYTLANLPSTNLSKVVAKVLFPMFSKLQADPPQLRVEYLRGVRLVVAVVVPISVAIVVLAHDIVTALYGAKWAAAAVPLQILAVFGCFQALWVLNGYLYNAIGKPHIDFYMNTSRLVLVLGLLYPLTLSYGLAGASAAVAIPMAVQFAAGVYLSRKEIGVSIGATVRPLAVAMGQGAVLAAVLIAVKSVIASDTISGLVFLIGIAGCVSLLFNYKDIRMQLATNKLSIFPAREAS